MGGSQHKHTKLILNHNGRLANKHTKLIGTTMGGSQHNHTHKIKIGSTMGGPYSNTRIYFRNKIAKSVIAKKALTRDQMCTKRTNFSLENHQRLLRLIRIQLQYAAVSY